MSPEQARGEISSLTPATDVWSLGCVLHEMLAGRPPWLGPTPGAVMAALLTVRPGRLRSARPDVPEGLERILGVALAKPAGSRYRDASALLEDLDRVLRGEGPSARPRRPWRRPLLVATALGVAGAGALLARPREPAPPSAPAVLEPSRAERLIAQAHAVGPSDPREAARLLDAALRERPEDSPARLALARSLFRSGAWREADAEFGKILEGASLHVEASLGRGVTRWLSRQTGGDDLGPPQPDLALAARLEPGPRGALARAILAHGAHGEQRWPDAEREIAALGTSWEARVVESILRHHSGRGGPEEQRKAVQLLTSVLEEGPVVPCLQMERGHARTLIGDLPGALADYDEALRLQPDYFHALVNRGQLRHALGDHAAALEDLTAALRLQPRSPAAWNGRGAVRAATGDLAGAREDYDAALEADPDHADALDNRGSLRLRLGDIAGALEDYAAALRIRPDDAMTHYNRGHARFAAGDPRGAIEDYDEALRLDPRMANAHANRGVVRRDLGDMEGAIEDYRAALRLDPDSDAPRRNLALAYHDLGRWREAAAEFSRFVRSFPTHLHADEARDLLRECEGRAADEEAARGR